MNYCKNCKYSTTESVYNTPDFIGIIYIYCSLEYDNPCRYYNDDGKCKRYKRKWWKFWIKP